jgi:Tfp pilus assembly protein PilO
MKRQTLILVALAAVLIVAGFWMLLWQPQREALAAVETEIATEETTQTQLQAELIRLREVREQAPAVVAELAAAESIIPFDTAIPSALRQLQTAADASGLSLVAVAPARPIQIEGAAPGVSAMPLNVQLEGSYFQVVDFLRRTEDPAISPRAILWSNIAVSKDEYPSLSVALTGSMFAQLPAPPPPIEEAPVTEEGEPADADADADADGSAGSETDATATETEEVAP